MKKIYLLVIIIVFLQSNTIYAQTKYYYFRFGSNISQFRNEGTAQGSGMILGAGWGYDEDNPSFINGFVNLELLYSHKRAFLEDKTWPGNPDSDSDIVIGDINMSVGYLELPLKIGYFTNVSKKGKFKLFTGLSISIPVINKTKTKFKDIIYYYPDKKEYEVDYERDDKDRDSNLIYDFLIDNIGNTSLNIHFGSIISWSLINLEFRYSYALSDTKNIINLTVHDKVDTYYMMLGISF